MTATYYPTIMYYLLAQRSVKQSMVILRRIKRKKTWIEEEAIILGKWRKNGKVALFSLVLHHHNHLVFLGRHSSRRHHPCHHTTKPYHLIIISLSSSIAIPCMLNINIHIYTQHTARYNIVTSHPAAKKRRRQWKYTVIISPDGFHWDLLPFQQPTHSLVSTECRLHLYSTPQER